LHRAIEEDPAALALEQPMQLACGVEGELAFEIEIGVARVRAQRRLGPTLAVVAALVEPGLPTRLGGRGMPERADGAVGAAEQGVAAAGRQGRRGADQRWLGPAAVGRAGAGEELDKRLTAGRVVLPDHMDIAAA